MKKQVSIVLIGIGGYGDSYVQHLLERENKAAIVGVIDIHPEKCPHYDQLLEEEIPIFSSLEDFYAELKADLAIISTPIHYHASQTCYALEHGSNVLCEKPMCATMDEAHKIIETRNRTGRFVAIGFNWSFSPAVQELKKDIASRLFGKPQKLKTIALWPRNKEYYNRSSWAGKRKSENGEMILDSIANNATAHFLHHMFYILGLKKSDKSQIKTITAELYRANSIETFDTCAINIETIDNVEVLFYASHAVQDKQGPNFIFEFENATITYSLDNSPREVTVLFKDGSKKTYSDPEKDRSQKLWACIQATASDNNNILCGPEEAYLHTLTINSVHQSVAKIPSFPSSITHFNEDTKLTWVGGISDALLECYNKGILPSDQKISWSHRGKTINLSQKNTPIS